MQTMKKEITKEKTFKHFDPELTFDTFPMEDNEFVYWATRKAISSPRKIYNPLFVYGDRKIRNHLIHAIGNAIISQEPNYKLGYMTGREFVSEFTKADENDDFSFVRDRCSKLDTLIMDGVEQLCESESAQIVFLQIFNMLHMNNKQIILSCDKPVQDMLSLDKRLSARFEWGLTVEVNPEN